MLGWGHLYGQPARRAAGTAAAKLFCPRAAFRLCTTCAITVCCWCWAVSARPRCRTGCGRKSAKILWQRNSLCFCPADRAVRLLRSGRHERYGAVREFLRGGTDKCQRLCTVKRRQTPCGVSAAGALRRAAVRVLLVNIVWPKRTQLEQENRKGRAAAGVQRCGTAGRQLAERVLPAGWDQFAFRDAAVNTQRAADEVLFRRRRRAAFCWARTTGCLRSSLPWTMPPRSSLLRTCRLSAILPRTTPGKVTFLLAPVGQRHLPGETARRRTDGG